VRIIFLDISVESTKKGTTVDDDVSKGDLVMIHIITIGLMLFYHHMLRLGKNSPSLLPIMTT
jgi:hypothetical protein